MKIVSFNVNSLRQRLHQLQSVIDKHAPEFIGLQEVFLPSRLHENFCKRVFHMYRAAPFLASNGWSGGIDCPRSRARFDNRLTI